MYYRKHLDVEYYVSAVWLAKHGIDVSDNFTVGTKMQNVVIQQLRPFVWFCQFFGVIPFFIVNNDSPSSKTFQKFSFSLCHPVTWWFSFLFISFLIFPIFDSLVVWQTVRHSNEGPTHIPTMFLAFVLQENVFFLLLLAATRYIIRKHACIRRAISLVQKVHDELMVEDMPSEYINSVRKHVIVAIIFPLIAVCLNTVITSSNSNLIFCNPQGISMMASNSSLFDMKVKVTGFIPTVLIVISRCFTMAMLTGSFFLNYLCYLIVSCYIRLIALNMERPQPLLVDIPVETMKTAW